MESLYLILPAVSIIIAILTQAAKAIDVVPVSNKTAKWFAFGLAVLFVVLTAWGNGSLTDQSLVASHVADIVLFFGGAVAFYEVFKRAINAVTDYLKKL
jgi:hypothetical protein